MHGQERREHEYGQARNERGGDVGPASRWPARSENEREQSERQRRADSASCARVSNAAAAVPASEQELSRAGRDHGPIT